MSEVILKHLILIFTILSFFSVHAGRLPSRDLSSFEEKQELSHYLNSLSKEELLELHDLKSEIEMNALQVLRVSLLYGGLTAFLSGAVAIVPLLQVIGEDGIQDMEDSKEYVKKGRVDERYVRLKKLALRSIKGGFLAMLVSYLIPLGGLGLDSPVFRLNDEDVIRANIREFVSKMSLEEARKTLSTLKDLKKELSKRKFSERFGD